MASRAPGKRQCRRPLDETVSQKDAHILYEVHWKTIKHIHARFRSIMMMPRASMAMDTGTTEAGFRFFFFFLILNLLLPSLHWLRATVLHVL